MAYTIYDLAEECGVSVATISRVINNSSSVRAKTREKVLSAMRAHDYSPNVMARGMNKMSVNIIGVLISDIGNPFFSEIVKSIDEICQKFEYKIILCSTENDTKKEERELDLMQKKQVDGLILAGSRPVDDKNAPAIREISRKIPVVMINSFIESADDEMLYSVMVDERQAALDSLRVMVDRGYRDLYLVGDPGWKTTHDKFEALKSICAEKNLDLSGERLIYSSFGYESGGGAAEKLLELKKNKADGPILAFCASDLIAVSLEKELIRRGVRIPEEIGILGYSNMSITSLVTPEITTVDQKMKLLGEQAANIFMSVHNGLKSLDKKILSPYELVERESTRLN